MKDIIVTKKELKNALDAVILKGKYKSFGGSKVGKISDTIACFVKPNKLILGNASYTLALTINRSSIHLSGSGSHATLPLYVEHKGLEGITKLMVVRLPDEGMAVFGKHTYDTQITVDGKYLAEAIKECSVVGNATYKLDASKDKLIIESSSEHGEETFTKEVTIMSAGPEEATVEISAPIDKFCDGVMFMYLSDDAPLLLIGADRKLVVAPYIRGE